LLATTFSCNQPVTVTEDGRVVLSGVPHRAPSKTFRFASRAQSVAAGKSTIIRVRLSRRLVSIIDSALLQHRHIAIIVTLTVTDLDGRRTTLTVLIRRLNVAHLKVPGH
jgi:antitoxin (DNA-binding transcriptional repressor) of toxin-antitoxin stability system